jgi:hypothetical protein
MAANPSARKTSRRKSGLAGVLPMIILVGIVPAAYSYFSFQAEKKASNGAHCPKNF